MTCEEFEQILLDSQHRVSGDGWMLRASKAALVQEHVNNCPACATSRAETTRLEDALDKVRISTMDMEAPAKIEKELLDAFQNNAVKKRNAITIAFPWRLAWVSLATLVLAATSILVYSKLRLDFVSREETGRKRNEIVLPLRSVPDVSNRAAQAIDQSRSAIGENSRTGSRHRFVAAHKTIGEPRMDRGEFPADDVLSLNGGGSVLRVTLPVSSLVAMGVPVGPDLSETRVTADVWMDPFGEVVGVRLVPANASAD